MGVLFRQNTVDLTVEAFCLHELLDDLVAHWFVTLTAKLKVAGNSTRGTY